MASHKNTASCSRSDAACRMLLVQMHATTHSMTIATTTRLAMDAARMYSEATATGTYSETAAMATYSAMTMTKTYSAMTVALIRLAATVI